MGLFFNWSKNFKEQPTCEDILKKVKKTEILYWIWMLISVVLTLVGISMIIQSPANDTKQLIMGLFTGVVGMILIVYMKLWLQIQLSMYFTIWDSNNRIEAEIRKSEAADL